jgi:hypothetical protein
MNLPNQLPVPSDRALRILAWVVAVALAAALVAGVVAFGDLSGRLDAAKDERAALRQTNATQDDTLKAQQSALDKANQSLKAAGKPTVPVPPAPTTAAPAPDASLTEQQVRALAYQVVSGYRPTLDEAQLNRIAATAAARVPKPKDGTSVTVADVLPTITATVQRQVAALPPAQPGKDGTNGTDGTDGVNGAKGDKGDTGAAGLGLDPARTGIVDGHLILAYTDGTTKDVGQVVGAKGDDGQDGQDGTAKPGTYTCPEGEAMTGFTVADDGSVTVACRDVPGRAPP